MHKFFIEIHKKILLCLVAFFVPLTHNNENAEAVNLTCVAPYCGPVH